MPNPRIELLRERHEPMLQAHPTGVSSLSERPADNFAEPDYEEFKQFQTFQQMKERFAREQRLQQQLQQSQSADDHVSSLGCPVRGDFSAPVLTS